jgi:hypothetical protein
MQDAAGDFTAAFGGREMRMGLAETGVHQFAGLMLHGDGQFQPARGRHAPINLSLERVGVRTVVGGLHGGQCR